MRKAVIQTPVPEREPSSFECLFDLSVDLTLGQLNALLSTMATS